MDDALNLGPLALPLGPLVLAVAVAAGLAVGGWLGRRKGVDAEPALLRSLLIGLVAARLAFVWTWRSAYFAQPWSVFDIRDGGWDPVLGTAAGLLYALAAGRRVPASRPALWGGAVVMLALWLPFSAWWSVVRAPGGAIPSLTLRAPGGEAVDLRGFIGGPTVVNLWATWCPPCRREMPLLQHAQAVHPDVNFVFIDQGEPPEQVVAFLRAQRLELRHVLLDPAQQAGAAFDRRGLPTTFFFDAKGRLVSSRLGALSEGVLAQRLQALGVRARPEGEGASAAGR